jgi:hypothetical protein
MKHPILSTFLRKLLVTILVPIVGEVYIFVGHFIMAPHSIGNDLGFFHLGIPLFSYYFLFIIGLPVSLFSSAVTYKLAHRWRMFVSLFIHTGGSFFFMTFYDSSYWEFFWIFVLPFAIIYWGLDEWFRRTRFGKKHKPSVDL